MKSLFLYCLEVNLYLIVIFLCYKLGFKKTTNYRFSRFFILLGIGLSITLPFIEIDSLFSNKNDILIPMLLEQIDISFNQSVNEGSVNVMTILIICYLLTSVALFSKLVWGILKLIKLKKQSITQGNYLLVAESTIAFSFFKWIYIGDNIPETDKKSIIAHEEVHSKNLHSVDIIICHLLIILFWINPITYLLKKELMELHEYEADQKSCKEPKSYIELLIKQNLNVYNVSFVHQFNSNQLKNRIMKIKQKSSSKINVKTLILSSLVLSLTFLFNQNINSMGKANPKKTIIKLNDLNNLSKLSALSALSLNKYKGETDKQAQFPGGQEALMKFLIKNLKYPEEAKIEKVEGTVYVQFKVDADGKCGQFEILKPVHNLLEKEAIEVLQKMPRWEPAIKDGKNVASVITLPIRFVPNPPTPPAPPTDPK